MISFLMKSLRRGDNVPSEEEYIDKMPKRKYAAHKKKSIRENFLCLCLEFILRKVMELADFICLLFCLVQ